MVGGDGWAILIVPLGRMKQLPLELRETGNIGPVDFIQLTTGGDQDVCLVFKCLTSLGVDDLDLPVWFFVSGQVLLEEER